MTLYPTDLELYLHDGISETVERKVYQDVTESKVTLRNVKHFASYANTILEIQVEYLDKSDILLPKLDDEIYIKSTLQMHHLERVSK